MQVGFLKIVQFMALNFTTSTIFCDKWIKHQYCLLSANILSCFIKSLIKCHCLSSHIWSISNAPAFLCHKVWIAMKCGREQNNWFQSLKRHRSWSKTLYCYARTIRLIKYSLGYSAHNTFQKPHRQRQEGKKCTLSRHKQRDCNKSWKERNLQHTIHTCKYIYCRT